MRKHRRQKQAVLNDQQQKYVDRILKGEVKEVEQELFAVKAQEAGQELQVLLETATNSREGHDLARQLADQHNYGTLRRKEIVVTIKDGQHIAIPTYYASRLGKPKGPKKPGPNGRGKHILLAYWGFTNKYSPGHTEHVARCGVSSASYDLAEAELQAQGMDITSKKIDHVVQVVGEQARYIGPTGLLARGETLAGKRVIVTIDGGRVRLRLTKTGRPVKGQKGPRFDTPWKEPKLVVITEIDEFGNKRKNTKPIYEATMSGPEEVYSLLTTLCDKLQLNKAKEVVFVNDGATWIWNLLPRLKADYPDVPITGIVDYFHACEHITELTEAHKLKSESEKKLWAIELAGLLRNGHFQQFIDMVKAEAKRSHCPELLNHLKYFETKRDYMHYDQYEKAKLPIGSGTVESAVKRVINSRLKATGSFWGLGNVDRMLHLRCALMAGRWQYLIANVFNAGRLTLQGK
jgi:hypothetical protein